MNSILNKLSKLFSTLPNLGPKSATRIVIDLAIKNNKLKQIIELLNYVDKNIKPCKNCNNLTELELCNICNNSNRDHNKICIIENINNLYAIENTAQYDGIYYVLCEESEINESKLIDLINDEIEKECIIALSPTLEGQATSYYLQAILGQYSHVNITTLSTGIPMGGDLDYLDTGTIAMALHARKNV